MKNYVLIISFIVFFACSLKEDDTGYLNPSKPSKIKDIVSMISLGMSEGESANAEFSKNEIISVVRNFFEALKHQMPMTASVYVSENFRSSSFKSKKHFVHSFKNSLKKLRVLKFNFDIEEVLLYGSRAFVIVGVNEVLAYSKSGTVDETLNSRRLLWVEKEQKGVKITSIEIEPKKPFIKTKGNYYLDEWLNYSFELPKNYILTRAYYEGALDYISLRHREKPLNIYLSTVEVPLNINSALSLLKQDVAFMKKLDSFKIVKHSKYNLRNYDSALIEFSYKDADQTKWERRIFIYRKPVMYVIGLSSTDKKAFKNGVKTFNDIVSTFSYIGSERDFLDKNHLPIEVNKPYYKNNFYRFSVTPPANWQLKGNGEDIAQYSPISTDLDALFTIKTVSSNGKSLSDYLKRIKKISKAAFKYYKIIEEKKERLGKHSAIYLKTKFKNRLLSFYTSKEELFIKRGDYVYLISMASKRESEQWRAQEFKKFLDGISLY